MPRRPDASGPPAGPPLAVAVDVGAPPEPRSARALRDYFARLADATAAPSPAEGAPAPAGPGAAARVTADRQAGFHDAFVRAAGFLDGPADASDSPRGGPPYAVPTPGYAVAWLAAEARVVAALQAERAADTPDAPSGAYLDAREAGLALVRLEFMDHARRTAPAPPPRRRAARGSARPAP